MGNALRSLCGSGGGGALSSEPNSAAPLGPHGVSIDSIGYAALARDLFQFEVNGQLPEELHKYVQSSQAAQVKWYRKLLTAWKAAQPPPRNVKEAAELVLRTLQGHIRADVEGILLFYGLPLLAASSTSDSPCPQPGVSSSSRPWPKGVQYELHTLPADGYSAVDGDSLIVYVDIAKDVKEAAAVPNSIQEALTNRRSARQRRDYKTADALQDQIKAAGYKVIDPRNGGIEILARKYRVRLRGVDAPENSMPFGMEAKAMLQSLVNGQPLYLLVYDIDQYGRIVADIHCSQGFVQEILLKNGGCWHYIAYDKRQEFAKWESEARARRLGLWESDNPEKPWDYRKVHKRNQVPRHM